LQKLIPGAKRTDDEATALAVTAFERDLVAPCIVTLRPSRHVFGKLHLTHVVGLAVQRIEMNLT
jgi:hypothetical protein